MFFCWSLDDRIFIEILVTFKTKQPVALITGGCRGIGYGIAQALSAKGFRLVLTGIRAKEEVQHSLDKLNNGAMYFQQDLADLSSHQSLIEQVYEISGRLDSLILNAGIAPDKRGDLLDLTPQSFDRVVGVNLRGNFFLAQSAAQQMISHSTGGFQSILFITSVSASMVSIQRGEYCISKAGAAMAAQLFAARLADQNIGVYELRPGIVATDMTEGVKEKYDSAISDGLVPMNRWGQPLDIGRAVASIVGGDFTFATGAVITVDGGLSIHRL